MRTLVHFFGLRRSGNHAVINWLAKNALPESEDKLVIHHNSVYSAHPLDTRPKDPRELARSIKVESASTNALVILSYEDCSLELQSTLGRVFEDEVVFDASQARTALILRDPFNTFASRLQKARQLRDMDNSTPVWPEVFVPDPKEVGALWKTYAAEYLGLSSRLGRSIKINFNQWVSDRSYRRELLRENFGVSPSSDDGISEVPHFGKGSSFDGLSYDGRAQEMEVLDRWKLFVGDPEYLEFFSDPEIYDLSELVFGHISGTEVLRPAIREGTSFSSAKERI